MPSINACTTYDEFNAHTVVALKAFAKDSGMKGYSKYNKDSLIHFILQNLTTPIQCSVPSAPRARRAPQRSRVRTAFSHTKRQASRVHIAVVLDGSGSMEDHKDVVIRTLAESLDVCNANGIETRWSFVAFDGGVHQLSKRPITGSDLDVDRVSRWYSNVPGPGLTNFFDAVNYGVKIVRNHYNDESWHKVLMVLTDGADNDSQQFPPDDLKQQFKLRNILAHPGISNFNVFMLTTNIGAGDKMLVDDLLRGCAHGHHVHQEAGPTPRKDLQRLLGRFNADFYRIVIRDIGSARAPAPTRSASVAPSVTTYGLGCDDDDVKVLDLSHAKYRAIYNKTTIVAAKILIREVQPTYNATKSDTKAEIFEYLLQLREDVTIGEMRAAVRRERAVKAANEAHGMQDLIAQLGEISMTRTPAQSSQFAHEMHAAAAAFRGTPAA